MMRRGVVQGGQELVYAHECHVDTGQGGHQAGVALVGDQADTAGLCHGEVRSGNAHVRFNVFLPQFASGHFDQLLDFRVLLLAGDLGEEIADLIAGEMDGRHDHVGGAFVAQLDDPFAQIGLGHFQTGIFQVMVEQGFLCGHGLGLDDLLAASILGNLGDDAIGLVAVLGKVDVDARCFGVLLELLVQSLVVFPGGVLGTGDVVYQAAHIHVLECVGASGAVGYGEIVESGTQKTVVQGLMKFFAVFFQIMCFLHG